MKRLNDLESYWMPFTANRDFKKDPRMVVSADGMYYKSETGKDIMDSAAGLWCVNAGHNRPEITAAISQQAATLDYAPSFQYGHPKAFELASRVAELFPVGLDHVFFTNSGSEAVDSALKIALAYQRVRGKGTKTRLIGRERGYHGVGFGGISVGGMPRNRQYFGTLLTGVDHISHTYLPEKNRFTKGSPQHGDYLADTLENIVALHDASTIAAVIVEPIAGSTGVLPPPQNYLKKLREICDKHDILLIFDEVITGFGRLGTATASEYFGVTPDIIACAKALTNGIIPMGAAVVSNEIYETMMDEADMPIELFHGYTYSGHPIAAAAGLASLDIYRDEDLFNKAGKTAVYLEEVIHQLKNDKNVIDIRNLGMVAAIEIAPRPGAVGARGYEAMKKSWHKGLMLRVTADTLAFSPPLIAEKHDIDKIFEIVQSVLKELD
ncbi:MAG: aspartate aminotransferase family protein [Proteobacteria bacterium]|jgi:beta-alanine--pyruvate transaminase|nr:aspartate aminotransferase family protein [Pseudomonadota bacterium]